MDQETTQSDNTEGKSNDKTEHRKLEWRYVFDLGFWRDSPVAILALFMGAIFLSPLTSFPGGNPKHLWYVAGGVCVLASVAVFWAISCIIARLEGRELLTQQEIDDRDATYRQGIQDRLNSLETGVGEATKFLTDQKPRRLTPDQRKAIAKSMAEFSGQKFRMCCALFDAEANRYAQDFALALMDAKWEYQGTQNFLVPPDYPQISVMIRKDTTKETFPPAASVLMKELAALGVTTNHEQYPLQEDQEEGVLSIVVAAKGDGLNVPPLTAP